MPQMNFDLEDGNPPVSFVLKAEDCARFVAFMRECDEGKKDAARFRWMRDTAPTEVQYDHAEHECGLQIYIPCEWSEDPKLDAAVDAAMAATPVFGAA